MSNDHATLGAAYLADEPRVDWHNKAVFNFRHLRDKVIHANMPEWEEMRSQASAIKQHTLEHLDDYLLQFEAKAKENGVTVHWASTAEEHNQIVYSLIQKAKATRVVKSKSMLTEECQLNPYLEARGVEIIDTDLGERIVQMLDQPPSHIVAPAIHLKKEEISDLFNKELGTEKNNADPTYLTRAARKHLREKFVSAQVGITGGNFLVADSGAVVVVTNEGNADLGCHIPPIQIHCVGIEKMIPRWQDLGLFVRMLAPSAMGLLITVYTSHYMKPKAGGEMHIVLVDNGRSDQLGSVHHRNSLKCIRCSACFNTCPVFRRTGGFSYHTVIGGPIGSILMPNKDINEYKDLPFASSLCGSCSDVCPVKIDIHNQLYKWRQEINAKTTASTSKKIMMSFASKALASNQGMSRINRLIRPMLKSLPRFMIYNRLNAWGKGREMPPVPIETFDQWYKNNRS